MCVSFARLGGVCSPERISLRIISLMYGKIQGIVSILGEMEGIDANYIT